MKKRILSVLLALCMVVGLLPAVALAAEEDWTTVATVEQLSDALANGGNIRLTDNITATEQTNWVITKETTLDLNGFSIVSSYAQINHYIMVIDAGSLTVDDRSEEGGGKIAATDADYGYGIQLRGTGSAFKLLNGSIETTQETVDVYDSAVNASITIAGGKLVSTDDSVLGVRGDSTTVSITDGDMSSNGRCGVYISKYGEANMEFSMTGGTLTHTGGRSGAIQAYQGATLNIGGEASISSTYYAVQAQENTVLNVDGGTLSSKESVAISAGEQSQVTVSGGKITTEARSSAAIETEDNSTVTIKGGEISTTSTTAPAIKAEGLSTVSISGGKIASGNSQKPTVENEAGATVIITGGEFSSPDEYVAQWTAYIESSKLGETVVPGSELKYSEVPDIQTVMAGGYSALWAMQGSTSAQLQAKLDELKASLVDAVKAYNLFLLEQTYNHGEGYVVNGVTYRMPEQQYTAAKAAIEAAETTQAALSAYQTALESQYTTDSYVAQWTAYIEASKLGETTVPGSELKYSEVPAIQSVMASGYSRLWALDGQSSEKLQAELDQLKTELLDAVKLYTKELLETVYNEGKGIEVGGVTYLMPAQAYNTAMAAMEGAKNPADVTAAYQTALNGQYKKDEVAIASFGFKMYADEANSAINELVKGLDGEPGTVSDSELNTMYVGLNVRTGTEAYRLVVTRGDGTEVYTADIEASDNAGVVYFTFNTTSGGSPAKVGIASGTYTASLMKAGWTDPINTMTIELAKVTFDPGDGEITKGDAEQYVTVGETVKIPSAKNGSFTLGGWYAEVDGKKTNISSTTAITGDTQATAQWAYIDDSSSSSSGSYTITVEKSANGAVKASSSRANAGSNVTLTVTADTGYSLGKLTVTDEDGYAVALSEEGTNKYSFKMPASSVTVKATFVKGEGLPFTDVSVEDWFYDAVVYAYENGMMNGTSATLFTPNATTTRGMIVTVLYRLENSPKVQTGNTFKDVAADQYYAEAVAWAADKGIVNGYTNGEFRPNEPITREQLAAILYRYASYKNYGVTKRSDLSVYSDLAQLSSYASDAMNWAVAEELFQGVGASLLSPKTNATRAQVATILMRFCENVAK